MTVIMTIIWGVSLKFTPKKPSFYGYKTKRSMTNQNTWIYANRVANNILGINILIILFLAIVLIYVFEVNEEKAVKISFFTFTGLSILTVPITEYMLYNKFFKNKNK